MDITAFLSPCPGVPGTSELGSPSSGLCPGENHVPATHCLPGGVVRAAAHPGNRHQLEQEARQGRVPSTHTRP